MVCQFQISYCSEIIVGSNVGVGSLSLAKICGIIPTKSISNSKIVVSGNFYIDQPLQILGSEVDMTPNSSMIINSGTFFSLYDTHMFCSEGMWNGIVANGTGAVSSSTIEDATIGVQINNNSNVNIRRSIFNNNIVGVECNGSGFVSVDQCNFTAKKFGLHNPYPAIFNTSYIGIHVKNVTNYFIVFSQNYFNTVQNGIIIENSTQTIGQNPDLNVYENILPAGETVSPGFGNAIYLKHSYLSQVGLPIGKTYSNFGCTNYKFNFINCKVGIRSENSTLSIKEDDFKNCYFGILVTNSKKDNLIEIQNCSLSNFYNGIKIIDNDASGGPYGIIKNNDITTGNLSVGGYGIAIHQEKLAPSVTSIVLSKNKIIIDQGDVIGIYIHNIEYSTIYANTISVYGANISKISGILLENASNGDVSSNIIVGGTIVYNADRVCIKVIDSYNSSIGCNEMSVNSIGLQIILDCEFSNIFKNKFKNLGVGLMYGNGTTLDGVSGNQIGTQNEWIGIFTKYKAWFSVDTGNSYNVLNSQYFVNYLSPIYSPQPSVKCAVLGEPWFYNTTQTNSSACSTYALNPPYAASIIANSNIIKMVKDTSEHKLEIVATDSIRRPIRRINGKPTNTFDVENLLRFLFTPKNKENPTIPMKGNIYIKN